MDYDDKKIFPPIVVTPELMERMQKGWRERAGEITWDPKIRQVLDGGFTSLIKGLEEQADANNALKNAIGSGLDLEAAKERASAAREALSSICVDVLVEMRAIKVPDKFLIALLGGTIRQAAFNFEWVFPDADIAVPRVVAKLFDALNARTSNGQNGRG